MGAKKIRVRFFAVILTGGFLLLPLLGCAAENAQKDPQDWFAALQRVTRLQTLPDEAVKAKTAGLVAGLDPVKDRTKILRRLFYFVSQNIRYEPKRVSIENLKAVTASEVLRRGSGDCKGESALLITMLKCAGIPSYFACIKTTEKGSDQIPGWNHCIVAVPENGRYRFLDPTSDMISFDILPSPDQGAEALIIEDDGARPARVPVIAVSATKSAYQSVFHVAPGGSADVELRRAFTGQFAWVQRMEAKRKSPRIYQSWYRKKINEDIAGLKIDELQTAQLDDPGKPYTLSASGRIGSFASVSGQNRLAFKVPYFSYDFLYKSTRAPSRDRPLVLGFARTYERSVIIRLPQGYRVRAFPKGFEQSGSDFSYEVKTGAALDKISIQERLEVFSREIPPARYAPLRDLIRKIRRFYDATIEISR